MAGIRQQRQQRTREALLDAAARVFAERGYADASVPDIAGEAGVSTGAIYSNFSGKQELFLAMMGRIVEAGADARAKSVANLDDRDELLAEMVATWTRTVDAGPEVVLLMAEFWLYALRHPPLGEVVAGFLAQVRANLVGTLLDAGAVDDRLAAERIAAAVQALAYGYAMQRLVDPDAVPEEQLTQAVGWLLAGAGATPVA
ncbi:TetR family transcriptional regulator [Nitriliruptoraceae bacterium ZYF776]|nr:TetR family transcriptional regulator [Profundirhabdus halotolerans]